MEASALDLPRLGRGRTYARQGLVDAIVVSPGRIAAEVHGSRPTLLVGLPDSGGLAYAGKVGTGFDEKTRVRLLTLLKKLAIDDSPFTTPIDSKDRPNAHYVDPEVVGEVQFGEWTGDGRLRHPSWRGVRPDKAPEDVRRE